MRNVLRMIGFAAMLLLAGGMVHGQEFPARPIKIVVPQPPGGGTDILARHVAQKMSEQLPGAVVVENRPGAGSLVGTEFVARAPADGYTLLMGLASNMALNVGLFKKLSYDPLRDFVAVGYLSIYPFVLLTRPDLPGANLGDFIQYAKERPGKLTYASAGVGSGQHVWGTILFKNLGIDLVHVPYKGAAAGHQDLMAGRVDVMFDNISASKHYVEAGRLQALAVSSPSRAKQLPSVPTINESSPVPYEVGSWFGLFTPAGTPVPVVTRLREVIQGVVRQKDFIDRIERDGGRVLDIPGEEQQKFLEQEVRRWSRLIKQYGITLD